MKYKGTLIVVKDCNRALKFYSDMSIPQSRCSRDSSLYTREPWALPRQSKNSNHTEVS